MTMFGVIYALAYDQVGSLRIVADGAGNVVKRIDYDTFGNIIDDTNSSLAVPFGFAGGLYDRDTRLIRFGYRDFDPNTGRWTAKDPIGFSGGDADLYGYVSSNPVNMIDPDGLHGITLFGRTPYFFRPSALRGPQRYVGRVRPFKETPVEPKYVPRRKPPLEMEKSWKGRIMDQIGNLIDPTKGFGGIGGISTGDESSAPCKSDDSKRNPEPIPTIYDPWGLMA
jgi:RHS repeat-associated protein